MVSEDIEENDSVATGEGVTATVDEAGEDVTATVDEEESAGQIISEEAEVTETANEVEESSENIDSDEEQNSTEG